MDRDQAFGLLAVLALIVEWKVGKSATQNNDRR